MAAEDKWQRIKWIEMLQKDWPMVDIIFSWPCHIPVYKG